MPATLVASVVTVNGIIVASCAVDPRISEISVEINGIEQALPTGSVVKNTVTGQKFIKLDGDALAFEAVSLSPSASWNLSESADVSWEILNKI